MRKTIHIIIACIGITLLNSCTVSYLLESERNDNFAHYINLTYGSKLSNPKLINWNGWVRAKYIPTRYDSECSSPSHFTLSGKISQYEILDIYHNFILHRILIIVNDNDTLPWVMERLNARISDFPTNNISDLKDSVCYIDFTNDSLPFRLPTSGLGRSWDFNFNAKTDSIDIKDVRKMRVEITLQIGDYMAPRVVKSRRRLRIRYTPWQGFVWYRLNESKFWNWLW